MVVLFGAASLLLAFAYLGWRLDGGVRSLRLVLAVAILAMFPVGVATPAQASCAASGPGNPYKHAQHVFVGKVAATDRGGFRAYVVVEQVWRGRTPKPIVTVIGGPLDPGVTGGESLELSSNTTYVFDASSNGPTYTVNACSATAPYAHVPERYRPEGLPSPKADPALLRRASAMAEDGPSHLLVLGVGGAVAAAIVGALLARSRRSRTNSRL